MINYIPPRSPSDPPAATPSRTKFVLIVLGVVLVAVAVWLVVAR